MTGKVITVAQHKGGSGKTTVSAQLAAAFIKRNWKVATIDADPQGSLTMWNAARDARLGDNNTLTHVQASSWQVRREVERLVQENDVVIIDSPPHAESEASVAIRAADLVLVPAQPSALDIWAVKPTINLILREGKEGFVVMNRVVARSKLNEMICDKVAMLDIPALSQCFGNRVAYASSIIQGLGVVESEPYSPASLEVQALQAEIAIRLKMKKQPRTKKAA